MRVSLPISTVGRASLRLQHAAHGVAQPQHEVGRDRGLADRAADAVGAEIGSAHVVHPPCRSIHLSAGRQPARIASTFSASTVAATSCTRTMRAPRCTAASAAATLAARRSPTGRPVMRAQRRLARPAQPAAASPAPAVRAGARSSARLCAARLAEADAGVEHDALAAPRRAAQRCARARAGSRAPRRPRRRSPGALCIVPARRACASGRRRSAGAPPPPASAPGRRSARDVVDDVGAEVERRAASPRACWCPPTPARPASRASRSTGSTRASSSSSGTGAARRGGVDSPPMSRMSAPSRQQLLAMRQRGRGVGVAAAVGERIRRDVDDAHHPRPRQVDREAGGLPVHALRVAPDKRNGAEAPFDGRARRRALRPRPARCRC